MSTQRDQIYTFIRLACHGDLDGVRAMIASGFDPATPGEGADESLLASIISGLEWESADGGWSDEMIEYFRDYKTNERHAIVRELIALGLPVWSPGDSAMLSPLCCAACAMDTEMVRILLDAGADPNVLEDDGDGHDDEAVLDTAENDYWVQAWNMKYPKGAGPWESMDARLADIDRLALEHGKRRPDHLLLLRSRGAKTTGEILADRGAQA